MSMGGHAKERGVFPAGGRAWGLGWCRHTLTFYERSLAKDSHGASVESWAAVTNGTCRAEVVFFEADSVEEGNTQGHQLLYKVRLPNLPSGITLLHVDKHRVKIGLLTFDIVPGSVDFTTLTHVEFVARVRTGIL